MSQRGDFYAYIKKNETGRILTLSYTEASQRCTEKIV